MCLMRHAPEHEAADGESDEDDGATDEGSAEFARNLRAVVAAGDRARCHEQGLRPTDEAGDGEGHDGDAV